MINATLLETKLYAPRRRRGVVLRPRLIDRLNRGAESKLTLVSAPAGFGKTTLLADWLSAAPDDERLVAWVSLDQTDNEPAVFWTYVIAALQTVVPGAGATASVLLQSPQPPPIEAVLPSLLNELRAIANEIVLVLDDYHLIEQPEIHEGVLFLLDHLAPRLHLVIASRADPSLPLARLRARGELVELRAADLRFRPEEAAAYFSDALGVELSPGDLAALETRTEGWIAGLQLAALSMQGRDDVSAFIAAFGGDDRYIVDYLVEEVLERQPAAIRRFLLETSILERLSGPLCDAITGDEGSRSILETLERGNLFLVPLDDKRQWYRYHRLFADVLQAHLLEEKPETIPSLHRRASEWHEQNALPSDAIRHALAANDFARAAGLVELAAQDAMRHHQLRRLVEWVKPLPDDLIRNMPVLSTYYAMALQGVGQMEASSARLSDAEWWLADAETPPAAAGSPAGPMVVVDHEAVESLPSRMLLARSYLAIAAGDLTTTIELSRRAVALLPPEEYHWRGASTGLLAMAHWAEGDLDTAQKFHAEGLASFEQAGDIVLALGAASHDADLLKARGRLSEAGRQYERSLQLATQYGDVALPGLAILYLGLSDLYRERGDLASATRLLEQGEKLSGFSAQSGTPYRRNRNRARLLWAQGDLEGAVEYLNQAEGVLVRGAVPDVRPVAGIRVQVWLLQGRLAEALAWTREQGLLVDDNLSYKREFLHITYARVLLAQYESQPDDRTISDVSRLLDRLRDAAEAGGRNGAVIEILVLQALVQRARGDIPSALEPLQCALAMAEPEGYLRLFVDEGVPMRELLHHAVAAGITAAYARRLLAAFDTQAEPVTPRASMAVAGLAESLTAREIEILRLLARGMRNQEIAEHLVLSPSTVKRHIANAYGKLSVGHRTEALLRAGELNLL